MAFVLADRVQETCSSPGTGVVNLLGAVTGYQTFLTGIGNGNTCYYTIADQTGVNWEVGIGTYTTSGNTLTRTTPISGSTATPVNFSSGTQNVFVTYPAERAVSTDNSVTLTNKTVEAATFTNGYTEEVATANTGTAYTINLANGSIQKLTLTGNCTYTFPTATAGRSFVLYQLQDATGSRTVSWPASVKWPSGTAPTLTSTASKADIFAFTADGTNWLGRTIGQAYL